VGDGLDKRQFTIDCRDNAGISKLISELNHGSLRKESVCNERR
jgi:hypothetical protein